jgi:hypothetical protein
MKFFEYDNVNGEVKIEDGSIFLITEFEDLLDPKRNINKIDKTGKKKEKAFRELKYIFLFFDGKSPYFAFTEQERHKEALRDSKLTEEEFNDPIFRDACKKYELIQSSSLELRLLKASMLAIESQIYYLEHVDLNERDPATGKPIFKSKDLIAEIKGCKDLISGLRELEKQVRTGAEAETSFRGNAEVGMFDR